MMEYLNFPLPVVSSLSLLVSVALVGEMMEQEGSGTTVLVALSSVQPAAEALRVTSCSLESMVTVVKVAFFPVERASWVICPVTARETLVPSGELLTFTITPTWIPALVVSRSSAELKAVFLLASTSVFLPLTLTLYASMTSEQPPASMPGPVSRPASTSEPSIPMSGPVSNGTTSSLHAGSTSREAAQIMPRIPFFIFNSLLFRDEL